MENSERGYLLPIDLMKAYDINTQIDIVYWSCNIYRQEIADILYSPDGTIQLLQLMADQLNAVKDEFEKYKRNSVSLPESREDRLPDKAPMLYVDWKKLPKNKWKTPLDCMEEVWGKYIKAGRLYQDDLRSKDGWLDPLLMKRTAEYASKHKHDLTKEKLAFFPPPKSIRIINTAHINSGLDKKKAHQVQHMASFLE